jgi:hypothetical protein
MAARKRRRMGRSGGVVIEVGRILHRLSSVGCEDEDVIFKAYNTYVYVPLLVHLQRRVLDNSRRVDESGHLIYHPRQTRQLAGYPKKALVCISEFAMEMLTALRDGQ